MRHLRNLVVLASLLSPLVVWAQSDPYLVQPQVQSDLENLLGRMIPSDQILVQVSTDVGLRQERQIVEGETITTSSEKIKEPVKTMPGFLPEVRDEEEKPPQRSRQVYRMVDRPFLKLVRASITFDDELEPSLIARAKVLVQNYLRTAYPNQAIVTFSALQMLKPKKEVKAENPLEDEKEKKKKELAEKPPEEPKKPEEKVLSPWEEYGSYGLAAFLVLMLWMYMSQSRARGIAEAQARAERRSNSNQAANPGMFGMDGRGGFMNPLQYLKGFGGAPSADSETKITPANRDLRKILLHRFLSRSQAFRRYYQQMGVEKQEELYACLKGPAYDNLLSGLAIKPPAGDIHTPPEKDELLEQHEKDFEEFVQAKDWQDRQFFGFVHDMSDEQLVSLVNHQRPLAVCLMLRFMTPHQSALILDSLPSKKRREILEQANQMNGVSFAEIMGVEREIRENVQRMPAHMFGSNKEDILYWGSVLTEAENQDGILKDIEHTNPGIYPSLKKYKFKLEDAASLPNTLLAKILAESDNDEVCLALATCPHELIDVFLDAVSPKRKEVIEYGLASSRGASSQEKAEARLKLTKRFREVMA